MDYHSMKRKELIALCKKHNIPANLTNLEMANNLSSLPKEDEKRLTRGKSCFKNSEIQSENDSNVVNKHTKKVRFSPESEMIEFERSDTKFINAKRASRRKSIMKSVAKKGNQVIDNLDIVEEIVDNPVRVTRSRAQGKIEDGAVLVRSTPIKKKKGKREVIDVGGSDKPPCVVDSPAVETQVLTRRSLRNKVVVNEEKKESKEVDDVVSRKSGRRRNLKKRNAEGSDEVSENKDLAEDGEIAEPENDLRQSKRNLTKDDGLELLDGNLAPKKTRSKTQLTLKDYAAESDTRTEASAEDQKDHSLQPARNGNRKKSVMCQMDNEEEIQGKSELEEPVKRAARNRDRQKSVMPQSHTLRVEEAPRRSTRNSIKSESVAPGVVTGSVVEKRKTKSRSEPPNFTASTNEEMDTHEFVQNNESPRQLTEPFAERKAPQVEEQVMRSRKSASRHEPVAVPGGVANAAGINKPRKRRRAPILEEETLQNEGVPLVEELPIRKTLDITKSDSVAPAVVTSNVVEKRKTKSSSKSPNLESEDPISKGLLDIKEPPTIDSGFFMPEVIKTAVNSDLSCNKSGRGTTAERRKLRRTLHAEKQESPVVLQTGYTEQEMRGSVSESVVVVVTEKVNISMEVSTEKSLLDSFPKAIENDSTVQFLDETEVFDYNNFVQEEPSKGLNFPDDADSSKNTSVADGYSLSDQSDSMKKLKETETKEERSKGKHTQQSSIVHGATDRTSAYTEQESVSPEDIDRVSEPALSTTAVDDQLAASNQSGGLKENYEDSFQESQEASFVDPSDGDRVTGMIQMAKDEEDTAKFIEAAELQESSYASGIQSPKVQVPLIKSTLTIDDPPADAVLSLPEVGESVRKTVSSSDKVPDDSDEKRMRSVTKSYSENEKCPASVCTGLSMEVGDLVAVTPTSNSLKLNSESVIPVTENIKEDSDSRSLVDPGTVECPSNICDKDIDENISGTHGISLVRQSDYFGAEGLNKTTDLGEGLETDESREACMLDPCDGEKSARKIVDFEGSIEAVDLHETVPIAGEDGANCSSSPSSTGITPLKHDTTSKHQGTRVGSQEKIEEDLATNENEHEEAEYMGRTSLVADEEISNAGNIHMHDSSHNATDKLGGQLVMVAGGFSERKCSSVFEDVRGKRMHETFIGEGSSLIIPGERNIGRAETFHLPIVGPEFAADFNDSSSCHRVHNALEDSHVIGQEYHLKNLFATPADMTKAIEDETMSAVKTNIKVGDGRFSSHEMVDKIQTEGYQLQNLFDTPAKNTNVSENEAMSAVTTHIMVGNGSSSQREPEEKVAAKKIEQEDELKTLFATPAANTNPSKPKEIEMVDAPLPVNNSVRKFIEKLSQGMSQEILAERNEELENVINKENMLLTTSVSFQEDELKTLFATPAANTNPCKPKEIDMESALSVDNTVSKFIDRLSQGMSQEILAERNEERENMMPMTSEKSQEDELKTLFATPAANTNHCKQKETDMAGAPLSVDNTVSKFIDRLNQGMSQEILAERNEESENVINKENMMPTTSEKSFDGGLSESWQEDELKIMFSAPATSINPCKPKETDMAAAPWSIDKTVSENDGRLSLEMSQETVAERSDECERVINMENVMPTTSEETFNGSSSESWWQEDQLKLLFATPVNCTNSYQEEETFGIEIEVTDEARALEKPIIKARNRRFSQGESEEMTGTKESQHEKAVQKGKTLAINSEDVNEEGSNESNIVAQETDSNLAVSADVMLKEFEASEEQMTAEHMTSTSKCTNTSNMLEEENKDGIPSLIGLLGLDKVTADHRYRSGNRNIETLAVSLETPLGKDGSCDEILSKVVKEKLSCASLEANFLWKNAEDEMMEGHNEIKPRSNILKVSESDFFRVDVVPEMGEGTSASEKIIDRKGDANLVEISNAFEGTVLQINEVESDDFAIHKKDKFHEMIKSPFLVSNECFYSNCEDGKVSKETSEDFASVDVAGTQPHDDEKVGHLESQTDVGIMEGKEQDVEAMSKSFRKGTAEVIWPDVKSMISSDGSWDNNRPDLEDNVRNSQQVLDEKQVNNDETQEEHGLDGEIVCQGSNKRLCDDEILSTSEETNEVDGSSQNIVDTVHCASESKDSAELQSFGDASGLKPALNINKAAGTSDDAGTELKGESHMFNCWEIDMFKGYNKVDKFNAETSETDSLSSHSEAAEDLKENTTSRLAVEQLDMHEHHMEEKIAETNANQIETSDSPISEHDEILKEMDVATTIKEYLDSEHNEDGSVTSVEVDNASVIMQNVVMTEVAKMSGSDDNSLVEPREDGDFMYNEVGNVGGEDDKASIGEEKCEESGAAMELRDENLEPLSRVADQSPASSNFVAHGGFTAEDASMWQPKVDSVRSRSSDANVEFVKQSSSITLKRKNARTSLTHETPCKPFMTADMKENAPRIKKEHIGNITMAKSAAKRRRALEELQNK